MGLELGSNRRNIEIIEVENVGHFVRTMLLRLYHVSFPQLLGVTRLLQHLDLII